MLSSIANGFVDLIVPPLCFTCDRLGESSQGLCDTCCKTIAIDPFSSCSRCGATVGPHSDTTNGCSNCRKKKLAFDRVVRLGPYEGLRRDVILRCKSDEVFCEAVATVFADRIAASLEYQRWNAIVPVPLHWWRRCRRGYNQAEVLARSLGAALGTPCETRLLRRVRATPFQTAIDPTSRWENVQGAFRGWSRNLQGLRIVVVDDVVTSGATAHEVARVLRGCGAVEIVIAALAHG